MMYVSDNGTGYSDNFFTLTEDMRIVNNFTGKVVGVFIRKVPSTNYLTKNIKPSIWSRFKIWLDELEIEWESVNKKVEGEALLHEMSKLDKDNK